MPITWRLRSSEWVLLAFFAYVSSLTLFFPHRRHLGPHPAFTLLVVAALLFGLQLLSHLRLGKQVAIILDWLPLALTFLAFRQMEWFVPFSYNTGYEAAWANLDARLFSWLSHLPTPLAFKWTGGFYLELCYLLIYGLGTYCVALLLAKRRRAYIDHFYVVLLTGTLLSYALFPFFPSRPPRLVFPELAAPAYSNPLRSLNLFLLRSATIHCGVFPSAHVSSAFGAAWGLFLALPPKAKNQAAGVLVFAVSVGLATFFGRYHYAADAFAGLAVGLLAAAVALFLSRRFPTGSKLT